jgi:hypothetical protein
MSENGIPRGKPIQKYHYPVSYIIDTLDEKMPRAHCRVKTSDIEQIIDNAARLEICLIFGIVALYT